MHCAILSTCGPMASIEISHLLYPICQKLRYCNNLFFPICKLLLTYHYMIFTNIRIHDVITLCALLIRRSPLSSLPSMTTSFSASVSRNSQPCSTRNRSISLRVITLINRPKVSSRAIGKKAEITGSVPCELTHINIILTFADIRQQNDCQQA